MWTLNRTYFHYPLTDKAVADYLETLPIKERWEVIEFGKIKADKMATEQLMESRVTNPMRVCGITVESQ